MLSLSHIPEGLRIVKNAWKSHLLGPKRYEGNAEIICRLIIEDCWNEKYEYFMTSRGNYPEFYSRDFGMCVDALLTLGHEVRVRKTLQYALRCYNKNGRVRLAINPRGKPFDFPNVDAPDGFAFFLHSLVSLNDTKLVNHYRTFLNKEVKRFYEEVVEKKTGLARRKTHFSGMRDYAIRDSSCYDNVMIAAVAKYATILGLENPMKKFNYEELLLKNFWNGSYFYDDMKKEEKVTGDANVAPFWFKIFDEKKEKELFLTVVKALKKEKLDLPLPLRYENTGEKTEMIWLERFASGWERDTVWLHLGMLFLDILSHHDQRLCKDYLKKYEELIEREHGFPEVLKKNGKLYKNFFFHADTSMLWAAKYLALAKLVR